MKKERAVRPVAGRSRSIDALKPDVYVSVLETVAQNKLAVQTRQTRDTCNELLLTYEAPCKIDPDGQTESSTHHIAQREKCARNQ